MTSQEYPLHDPYKEGTKDEETYWNNLTLSEQADFLNDAAYMINRGYVLEEDQFKLAKRIAHKRSLIQTFP